MTAAAKVPRSRNAARACRVCGCTNFRACPGGCFWVQADLCSACSTMTAAIPAAKLARLLALLVRAAPQVDAELAREIRTALAEGFR